MTGPLYRQIADQLRHMIEARALKPGMQIPTEDQLMEQHHASRNTVRGALKELTTRGLVYTLHGRGTFVSEPVAPIVITLTSDPETGRGGGEGLVYTAEVMASGRSPEIEAPEVGIRRAGAVIGRILQIPEETEVIFRHQERIRGRSAVVAADLVLSPAPGSSRPSVARYQRYRRRDRRLPRGGRHPAGRISGLIGWRTPDEAETAYFDLPADGHVQVAEIRRIAFDQDGNRVRLTFTTYRADRNRFVINVGQVPENATA